jgi:formylmethanofuran dehydrogenase subunit B
MLCDDVAVDVESHDVRFACDHGGREILRLLAKRPAVEEPLATIDGKAVSPDEALDAAVARLRAARRPLVTGLAAAPLDAQRSAADLAERLAAAFDTGARDGRLVAGPTIARAGEVTAVWEELRDRADLVLLWFVDPAATHPRFIERFLAVPAAGGARRVLAVGGARQALAVGSATQGLPGEAAFRQLAANPSEAVTLARAVEAALLGPAQPADSAGDRGDPRVAAMLSSIREASCIAIVTGDDDAVGIADWSVARMVRAAAHRKPAFTVPLGPGVAAGGGNAAGAAAIATWRYGAAAAIHRADDRGASFRPCESDGLSLLRRGEADLVVVTGGLSGAMRRCLEATAAAGRPVDVVWIGDEIADVPHGAGRAVFIRAAHPLFESAGGMLREDGRLVSLRPIPHETGVGPSPTIAGRLRDLVGRLDGGPARPRQEAAT